MEMAAKSATLSSGHYSLKLSFKQDVVSLPNKFSMVKQVVESEKEVPFE